MGVTTPSSAKPDGYGDYDVSTSVLSTSWEEGDESYFCAVPLSSNGYSSLAAVSPFPDYCSEQCRSGDRMPDSREDSRTSLLWSTRFASEEFELQEMPAKPASTALAAVPATTHERGDHHQVNASFELEPGPHGIQSVSTQQYEGGLDENHQSKKLSKLATASTSRKSWLKEKLRRKR